MEACFNDPYALESFWYLTRFMCTRTIAFWTTLRFGKDAKGLFTVIVRALEKHFSFNERGLVTEIHFSYS